MESEFKAKQINETQQLQTKRGELEVMAHHWRNAFNSQLHNNRLSSTTYTKWL